MASSPLICDITPVDGVNITIKTDNISQDFEIEWRDSRCLPSSSDADVSRNATPRAFNENSRNMMGLVTLLQRIVFGELVDDKLGSGCKQARNRYSSRETGVTYIHLQHRTSRHLVQKIEVCTDTAGDLVKACLLNDTREPTLLKSPLAILKQLGKMCSNEEGWTLIRPVVWADLPSELWWHVLKNMTAKEGSAMACTFSTIPNIIRNQNFVWLPSELHLVLLTAQEAVRCDPSTHLPLNLQQGEFKIGRSRTNDVVLLRDPEVSKRHCKIWRDARGDVYIQVGRGLDCRSGVISFSGSRIDKWHKIERRLAPTCWRGQRSCSICSEKDGCW